MNEFIMANDIPSPSEWNEDDMNIAMGSCLCNHEFRHLASIIKEYIPKDIIENFIQNQCNPDEYEDDASFIEALIK